MPNIINNTRKSANFNRNKFSPLLISTTPNSQTSRSKSQRSQSQQANRALSISLPPLPLTISSPTEPAHQPQREEDEVAHLDVPAAQEA